MPAPPQFHSLYVAAGQKHDVDAKLLEIQGGVESGWNPRATSPAGAEGIAQLMPATAAGLGVDPFDPAQAIDAQARLMANYLRDYGGDVSKALAAYNAGPGAVEKFGGVPPFPETQEYVTTIESRYAGGKKSKNGLHLRIPTLRDPLPIGGIGDAAGDVAGDAVDAVGGRIIGAIRRPLLEGVIVLGAVVIVAGGAYLAVTGKTPREAAGDAAENVKAKAAQGVQTAAMVAAV